MPPLLRDNSSNWTCSRFCASSSENNQPNYRGEDGEVSPCGASGVPFGLCSCRVVLRTGVSLPLSIAAPPKQNNHTAARSGSNDINDTESGSSRSRWLVLAKATGGELTLSLLRPSRVGTRNGGEDVQSQAPSATGTSAGSRSGTRRRPHQQHYMLRRPRLLVIPWEDWAQLGYGPLQWMSHAQKTFIARLSVYWISLKAPTVKKPSLERRAHAYMAKNTFRLPEEAFLYLRPILYGLSRVVGTPSETSASVLPADNSASLAMSEGSGNDRQRLRAARVFVRDEGSVLRVEVDMDGESFAGPHYGFQRLERTFGKEAWQETGLGELLWLDCPARQYLARRLAQQARRW